MRPAFTSVTGQGIQQHFSRMTPEIVNDDIERLVAGFADKSLGKFLVRLVEVNGRVGTQIVQRP